MSMPIHMETRESIVLLSYFLPRNLFPLRYIYIYIIRIVCCCMYVCWLRCSTSSKCRKQERK